MTSVFPIRLSFTRLAFAAAGMLAAMAAPAVAQNYEGPHQVRVGAFLQAGGTTLNGFNAGASETGSLANNGFGITGGLEFLRQGGWTYGIEGDFGLGKGQRSIVGARYATDYFGNLRGRIGVYARPDFLLYGTAGIAFRGVNVSELTGASNGKTLTGGIFGAGAEWHRGDTILFTEYLHSVYSNANDAVGLNTYGIKGNSDVIRVGVKFKVGFDGYYDEVRDSLRR
jgi:hypothetical protein